ncbi:HNH endonuclease signature motif containing protein [Enterococcus durans]|uniref:HNH endonuclease signature motif containing protein n=1 Tax=Enterococcus durans TaxID=53345 RepID=UPI001C8C5817|nr:HNH endonuclease signature motif containing protein [Enterococcus durans]MBX9041518.1 HNH endonuclease [Enterococcus durans]MBX9078440.1 HNH endonuclease [Enterococcus durans]
MISEIPKFIIKKNFQKSKKKNVYVDDVLTQSDLTEICLRLTGKKEFECNFVDNNYEDEFIEKSYNKGRLAILHYDSRVMYITFSEKNIGSRNSSVQSVPSAFNSYYLNNNSNKELYYYFLDDIEGNPSTDYHMFMYRLMKTSGFIFINDMEVIGKNVLEFVTIEDLILSKRKLREKTRGNNSSYITKNEALVTEIFGKTYGANKYETSMICYAASKLIGESQELTLYQVQDQSLSVLPKKSLQVLAQMRNVNVKEINSFDEKDEFYKANSLRSPKYIFGLLERLGDKKCAMCNCDIPEIIQGAHIWPVSKIKKEPDISDEDKLSHAISDNNGIWLCQNHHKLFDSNTIILLEDGNFIYNKEKLSESNLEYLDEITKHSTLTNKVINTEFIFYLNKRNADILLIN